MKKTDIAMIILIASVSVLISYFVVSSIPGVKVSDEKTKVKTIDKYDSKVGELDSTVFNKNAINPTVEITIGDSK